MEKYKQNKKKQNLKDWPRMLEIHGRKGSTRPGWESEKEVASMSWIYAAGLMKEMEQMCNIKILRNLTFTVSWTSWRSCRDRGSTCRSCWFPCPIGVPLSNAPKWTQKTHRHVRTWNVFQQSSEYWRRQARERPSSDSKRSECWALPLRRKHNTM